ncbi:hypothetical protein PSCICL_17880 [Pseudomonas cichorii]|uniref:HrpT n=1 Tax=Pseudomonas cichorii TaxID=36746 RepID=Q20IN3_PSECI|nr:HrpT [Pseudomonas cichorii]GFM53280.1 hypothetical protein PSCICE_45470 [Pseudomonas cichorii]GFM58349.1 hypothetical protein PSCICF_45270 [Pseudomonas cichorii]GFM63703.1 hypothetical protein PSCICG_48630 [Pseudomonas cichorii]GFM70796.1 hypothetical protein PSCICL_17880 [Pseudomonas cichorii]
MKLVHAGALFIVTLLLSACATMQSSCSASECQQVDANSSGLKVWWAPELRNDATEYTTVHLND